MVEAMKTGKKPKQPRVQVVVRSISEGKQVKTTVFPVWNINGTAPNHEIVSTVIESALNNTEFNEEND